MSSIKLGRLQKVDLRKAWANEAGDFTPWLAQDANIALLGETIGLELEVESQEKAVGPFRADILCKDIENDQWVLIENQLEKTDHNHLGQLLTYAAGLDTVTIVWIAQYFSEEHRAALDSLNEINSEDISFFGLEVELWQIGESAIAPKFNVVSKPNEWMKKTPLKGKGSATRLEYWQTFREMILTRDPSLQPRKAAGIAQLRFKSGRKGYWYATAAANRKGGRLSVALAILGKNAQARFELLKRDRNEIESKINLPLEWIERPGRNIYRVRTLIPGNYENRDKWPEQHEWLLKTLLHFRDVFAERIATLPDSTDSDDEDEDDDS